MVVIHILLMDMVRKNLTFLGRYLVCILFIFRLVCNMTDFIMSLSYTCTIILCQAWFLSYFVLLCSPGWPHTCRAAEHDLEVLVLSPAPPTCQDDRHVPMLVRTRGKRNIHTAGRSVNWCSHHGSQCGGSSKKLKIELPAFPLPRCATSGYTPEGIWVCTPQRYSCC